MIPLPECGPIHKTPSTDRRKLKRDELGSLGQDHKVKPREGSTAAADQDPERTAPAQEGEGKMVPAKEDQAGLAWPCQRETGPGEQQG